MHIVVLILHVLAALCVVGLVLLQHGKGADMGAAFGSGSAGSLFGASGSANFLSRSTAVLAAVFFLTSMGLTYFSFNRAAPHGVMTAPLESPSPVPTPTAPQTAPAQSGGEPASKANEIPK
jgi:preprotein translocase subunit SecG